MPDKHSPNVVRHLEMIQDVIRRMASNSFAIRRWSISTIAALVGAAVATDEPVLAFGATLPGILYWGLDTYYLNRERWFRALYDKVRTSPDKVKPFSMKTRWPPKEQASYQATFLSGTELLSHLPLLIVTIVAGVVLVLCE